jgi:hypothetical protein
MLFSVLLVGACGHTCADVPSLFDGTVLQQQRQVKPTSTMT